MNEWVLKNCKDEREKTWSEAQFIYKLRKKALGPFKKELWDLKDQEKNKILDSLNEQFQFIFKQLNIQDTKQESLKYI